MNLFLDCEFNGFGGELISLALVDEEGHYFYEVLDCPQPMAWVAENVMPYLGQKTITLFQFQRKLRLFLNWYSEIHIIADWAEDLSLFTRSLIVGAGQAILTPPLTLELWQGQILVASEIPHHALSDAKALAQSYRILQDQH
ncbi:MULTISPECIES: hypothetical protein [Acinetobacter]|uniref:hypothetical protein n=1 Tax=Acinetobacter TaxID=469 RepID=UPI000C424751|nr:MULTISPECIES: hypothetical protein [Acinetobacter]MBC70101.1 hypothetical protein [Acinetobacter sp.]MBT50205.1 hypothetical protein [Acinetobacter sp.]HIQ33076.1 hypothetical protein [Acinetobacter venetianus]